MPATVVASRETAFVLLEVFAGLAGLSHAFRDIVGVRGRALSLEVEWENIDLDSDVDFTRLFDRSVSWMHSTPPARTFSLARRSDAHASVKVLRSAARPEGFGCPVTKKANRIAERAAELAMMQLERHMFFSIVNPMGSLMWQLRIFKKLAVMPGVDLRIIDLCAAGSAHRLPTAVLTNCP